MSIFSGSHSIFRLRRVVNLVKNNERADFLDKVPSGSQNFHPCQVRQNQMAREGRPLLPLPANR